MEKTIKHHSKIIKAYSKCPYVFGCTKCYIYKFKRKQMFERDCRSIYEASHFKLNLNTWEAL